MNSYKLLFDWQISMPDNWQGEYDEELTEDSSTICVVYVGYYSAGELLSISVWSTNKDEGEQALNILNTIRK